MSDTDIVQKESSIIPVDEGGNIDIVGISAPMSELPLPSIRLVHPTSRNIVTDSGEEARPGTFYNNITKKSYIMVEMRVLHITKGFMQSFNDPEKQIPVYWVIAYHIETGDVFTMSLKSSDYYSFRSSIFPLLVTSGQRGHVFDVTIKLNSKKISNKNNVEYWTIDPIPNVKDVPSEEESKKLLELQKRFMNQIHEVVQEDVESEELTDEEIERLAGDIK